MLVVYKPKTQCYLDPGPKTCELFVRLNKACRICGIYQVQVQLEEFQKRDQLKPTFLTTRQKPEPKLRHLKQLKAVLALAVRPKSKFVAKFLLIFRFCLYLQEYTPNGDLHNALKSAPEGRFDETTAARFTLQMAQALKYLYSKKLIHLDVKPENFLLDSQGSDQKEFQVSCNTNFRLSKLESAQLRVIIFPGVVTCQNFLILIRLKFSY